MLKPAPGRCVVKMNPVSRIVEFDIVGIDGQRIELLKPDETVHYEEMSHNIATVVCVAWREDESPWFEAGDRVVITRVAGTEFKVNDGEKIHSFWLMPVECIQGVFEREEVADA